jgi:cytochrome c-type biogenesis protein
MVENLLSQLEGIAAPTLGAFTLVALMGFLTGLAPSSLPLVSVVVGAVAGQRNPYLPQRGRAVLFSTGFVCGIATADALLGAIFGFLGFQALRLLSASLGLTNLLIAAILTVIGLALLRIIRIPTPLRGLGGRQQASSFGGAFLLGVPFGLTTCPACTPLVLPVFGAAAATADPVAAAALLFAFGVARGLPLVVAGAAAGSIKHLRHMAPIVPKVERAGGALVLAAALYFAYQAAGYAGMVPIILLGV